MKRLVFFSVFGLGLLFGALSNCSSEKPKVNQRPDEPIKPITMPQGLDQKKVALGDKLFHDTRLSVDNTVSCASCHGLDKGGTDLLVTSTGVGGQKGPINSPTVYNSSFNFVQFWDGRAKDLREQALGPVENPIEMGEKWDNVVKKISADPEYKKLFAESYNSKITKETIADAIAIFEETLVTPNSRFDKWLYGDDKALTQLELKGYEFFKGYGCTTCHAGANVGGTSFQKMGLIKDYFSVRGNVQEVDLGRYNVTKKDEDKHKFKVPSLRTAAITPPYLHDGTQKTLPDVVRIMGRHQVGVELTDEEVKALVAFIKSLTGEYKGKPLLTSN